MEVDSPLSGIQKHSTVSGTSTWNSSDSGCNPQRINLSDYSSGSMASRSLYRSVLDSNQSNCSNSQNVISGSNVSNMTESSPLLRRKRFALDFSPVLTLSPVSSMAVDLNSVNISTASSVGLGNTPCRRLSMNSSVGGNTPLLPAANTSISSSKSFPPERSRRRFKQHLSCSELYAIYRYHFIQLLLMANIYSRPSLICIVLRCICFYFFQVCRTVLMSQQLMSSVTSIYYRLPHLRPTTKKTAGLRAPQKMARRPPVAACRCARIPSNVAAVALHSKTSQT